MHNAPSVFYPVGRSRLLGLLLLMVWLLGLAATLAFAFAPGAVWRVALVAGCTAAAGLVAARWWLRSPAGGLQSDGTQWLWQPQGGVAAVALEHLTVHLDLQHALLLRGQQGGAPLWLWAERGMAPLRWDDLRRAVYSPASVAAPR
jgi:toxin CptA